MEKTRIIVEPFCRAQEIELGEWVEIVQLVPKQIFYLNIDKDEKIYCPASDNYMPGVAFGGIFFVKDAGQIEEIVSYFNRHGQTPNWPKWPEIWPIVLILPDITKDISETIKIVSSVEKAFPAFCSIWEYIFLKSEAGRIKDKNYLLQGINETIKNIKFRINWQGGALGEGNHEIIFPLFVNLHLTIALRNFLIL